MKTFGKNISTHFAPAVIKIHFKKVITRDKLNKLCKNFVYQTLLYTQICVTV